MLVQTIFAGRRQFSGIRQRARVGALSLLITLGATAAVSPSAQAQTYSVLYSFGGTPDGEFPSGLVRDTAGNLYGTTAGGGIISETACNNGYNYGCGVVFKIDTTGSETVLHRFTGGGMEDLLPEV